MATISFDFENIYKDEYQKRLSGASFYKYLDEENLDLVTFIKEILPSEKNFYVSCSSLTRNEIKEVGFDIYKNYFFRPQHNSLILKDKKSFYLNGDLVFEKDFNSVFFRVKDIYICDDVPLKKFERSISFSISFKQKEKKGSQDTIFVRNIIETTPIIYDQTSIDLINKWDDYLEFEKKFFIDKLGYYQTRSFSLIQLKEVKRTMENVKKYQDKLYFDDGSNYIYLHSDFEIGESDDDLLAIEFEVIIKKDEDKRAKLNFFVNQDIELANEKEALDKNRQLISSNNEFEFSFKTRRLGGLLKPLEVVSENEKEIIYRFSKFWVDELSDNLFSSARINEFIIAKFGEYPLLVNTLSGDVALYKRGKQALRDIKEGNVKNPGIIGYLMNVDYADESLTYLKKEEIKWSTSNLDEYQKEAIYRALNSNSIFLLQGPPGTGKTQTITEMVYQFNKMKKKVLLSSQTHIAIDNVLERLPDELDILPIRLINSERKLKASKNFLPDKLVDNFYNKTISKYIGNIEAFKLYSKEVASYYQKYLDITKIITTHQDVRQQIRLLEDGLNHKKNLINNIDNVIVSKKQMLKDNSLIIKFIDDFKKNNYQYQDYQINILPTDLLSGLSSLVSKYKIDDYYSSEYTSLNDYLKLFFFYMKENTQFNNDYQVLINKNLSSLDEKKQSYLKQNIQIENEIKEEEKERVMYLNEVLNINNKIKTLSKPFLNDFKLIKDYYDSFFDHKLSMNKIPVSDEEKLKMIKEYIDQENEKFKHEELKYECYKDIYQKSIDYLSSKKDEILEKDRVKYSKYLLNNNANVFGITCNANSKYLQERNDYLKTLGLGNIDLKNIDFDVVIIDEVSKVTLVELLIPIIYGKSIILVGDHRQLPPMFKYKENMFSTYSLKEKVPLDLNYYQGMVEESVFKNLFAKAKRNKFTLLKQYRSHQQIMEIVNIFYDERLQMGYKNEQNEAKKHYLDVNSEVNQRNLFSPNIHTYWFNSHYNVDRSISYEKKLIKGSNVSTSFYNEEEIYLTKKILSFIDKGYENLLKEEKIKEAPSIGVISLYGDQVKELKKEIDKMSFKSINFSSSKISTVDEFQGKEEDIIIVNFVRNNRVMQAGEFTKKFERINVALSRARKMLIIVGSKEFFTSLKVKMEDSLDENKVEERKIYQEIYQRIKGKIDEPNSYFGEDK